MNKMNTHAKMRNLLLTLMFAASGLRTAVANEGAELEQAAAQARQLIVDSRVILTAAAARRPADDVNVFVRLTGAQVARLREIAEGTKPKRRTILRMGEGSVWHRFWASFYSHDDAAAADTIELSVRKSRLLWLHDRRIDFRISPLTATATASVHAYSTSCPRYSCEESSSRIAGMDMRTAEVREWFREEIDFWMAVKL